jgi:hypothetical protein
MALLLRQLDVVIEMLGVIQVVDFGGHAGALSCGVEYTGVALGVECPIARDQCARC